MSEEAQSWRRMIVAVEIRIDYRDPSRRMHLGLPLQGSSSWSPSSRARRDVALCLSLKEFGMKSKARGCVQFSRLRPLRSLSTAFREHVNF